MAEHLTTDVELTDDGSVPSNGENPGRLSKWVSALFLNVNDAKLSSNKAV